MRHCRLPGESNQPSGRSSFVSKAPWGEPPTHSVPHIAFAPHLILYRVPRGVKKRWDLTPAQWRLRSRRCRSRHHWLTDRIGYRLPLARDSLFLDGHLV